MTSVQIENLTDPQVMEKQPQSFFTRMIAKFYPSELDRITAVQKSLEKKFEDRITKFKIEVLLASGKSVKESTRKMTDEDVIESIKQLAALTDDTREAAKELRTDENSVIDNIRSIPQLEEKIERFKALSASAVEKKKALIAEQKDHLKARMEKAESKYEQEKREIEEEMKKLNADHITAAKEEAEVKQEIINEEEK